MMMCGGGDSNSGGCRFGEDQAADELRGGQTGGAANRNLIM